MQQNATIEGSFAALGLPLQAMTPDMSGFAEEFRNAVLFHYQLMVVAKAIKGAWVPDWKNKQQKKWFVWYWIDDSGFGLSLRAADYVSSNTFVGSRLVFETRDQAAEFFEKSKELHAKYVFDGSANSYDSAS